MRPAGDLAAAARTGPEKSSRMVAIDQAGRYR